MEGRRPPVAPRRMAVDRRSQRMNTTQRAGTRFRDRTAGRSPRAKIKHKRAWLILDGLGNWLGKLFDRVIKTFFDALFDHLRKV